MTKTMQQPNSISSNVRECSQIENKLFSEPLARQNDINFSLTNDTLLFELMELSE